MQTLLGFNSALILVKRDNCLEALGLNTCSDTLKIWKRHLYFIVQAWPSESWFVIWMHNWLKEHSWIWKTWSTNWIFEAGLHSPNQMSSRLNKTKGDHQKILIMVNFVLYNPLHSLIYILIYMECVLLKVNLTIPMGWQNCKK